MTGMIHDLIKRHKEDLDNNYFDNIIVECPVMNMTELLEVFDMANIVLPNNVFTKYAYVCRYLSSKFTTIYLRKTEETKYQINFEFSIKSGTYIDSNFRGDLYDLEAKLTACNSDWDGVYSIAITMYKDIASYYKYI